MMKCEKNLPIVHYTHSTTIVSMANTISGEERDQKVADFCKKAFPEFATDKMDGQNYWECVMANRNEDEKDFSLKGLGLNKAERGMVGWRGAGGGGVKYESMTVADLKKRASKLKIKGYSSMRKHELIAALRKRNGRAKK